MEAANQMRLIIPSLSENEALARVTVGAFAARLNPTLEQVSDIKTAVSEAVTNAIIHGYEGSEGNITVYAAMEGRRLTVEVIDYGKGIADIAEARQPFYTSRPDLERSGMGFTVMETLMDKVTILSQKDQGTCVRMEKEILPPPSAGQEG